MQGASLVLTSYQDSLRQAMDTVANNVANVNTTGFKRETAAFDTYVVRPTTRDVFQFAVESGTYRDGAQGSLVLTGSPLDVAVRGHGYLSVQTPEGVRYTRAGSFQLSNEGLLVTSEGEPVLGDGNQEIALPADAREIVIGSDGTISAVTGNATKATQVGKLSTVRFSSEQNLAPIGRNLFASNETPEPDTESRIVQGGLEQSNVQPIVEMTRMIDVSRTYQMTIRLLDTENQRLSNAIQRLGKISA